MSLAFLRVLSWNESGSSDFPEIFGSRKVIPSALNSFQVKEVRKQINLPNLPSLRPVSELSGSMVWAFPSRKWGAPEGETIYRSVSPLENDS